MLTQTEPSGNAGMVAREARRHYITRAHRLPGVAGTSIWRHKLGPGRLAAGRFELPDYYLVLAADVADHGPDFHLGPLRSTRPHRVAVVAAAEPAQQAAGVLQALGSLRHGPWWPALDEVIETARTFYPDSLAENQQVTA